MGALIMIADDSPEIVSMLGDLLSARGYQIVSVPDGVQMVEKAKDWQPQLIISDIMMPGAYGSSAYKSLQQDPQTAKIPVIFLTAVAPDKAQKVVTPSATVRILYKPLDIAKLIKEIEQFLNAPK